jgi:hypothetical protein
LREVFKERAAAFREAVTALFGYRWVAVNNDMTSLYPASIQPQLMWTDATLLKVGTLCWCWCCTATAAYPNGGPSLTQQHDNILHTGWR